ncbi:MFS transporter [Limoniibacter endophyticus]|uniref:MFS transporter n=1 Tax=Limoniibacter endophyticus TaxID=1565040 RepID=A0A8J3DHQ0_9HYPH|nr:MFS transporter [Limoniibacter endophyticus]GHC72172.1 MFS transporter [Limoniibacter endophyticus]
MSVSTHDPISHKRPSKAQMRKIVAASVAGNALEWYDFFLYGTAAALVFSQLFFPAGTDPLTGTLAAFAGFAVGFAARPFGGIVFGHLGDRLGRKYALVLTLSIMGAATFAIGLLPTYEQIGIWAPALLVLLRLLQGIAAGGEWGGGVLIISENAPPEQRGLYSAWSQVGVAAGFVLSAGAFYLAQLLPHEAFMSWGWRVPFLISIVIFALGIYIRYNLPDSAEFKQAQTEKTDEKPHLPLKEVLRRHPREVLLAMGLRVAENGGSYIFLAFALAYGKFAGADQGTMLLGVMLSMTVALGSMVFFGHLSDKIGRRPVFMFGAVGIICVAFPFFWLIDTLSTPMILIAFLLGNAVCHAAMVGTMPAFFSELFDPDVRYTGVALGHEIASVFAGGMSPLIATALLAGFQASWPISLFLAGLGLISVIAVLCSKETASGAATPQTTPVERVV